MVQETVPVQGLMWSRYGDYLEGLGGVEYRDKVFEYIITSTCPAEPRINSSLLAVLASPTSNDHRKQLLRRVRSLEEFVSRTRFRNSLTRFRD